MFGEVGAASILLLVVFIFLSAFFSGSEAALLSVQRVRIQHLVSIRTAGAARVAHMTERPEKLLPPILLGNNLVNTGLAALATAIAISIFDNENQAVLIATGTVTVLLLIFGETLPKTAAARRPELVSIIIALRLSGSAGCSAPRPSSSKRSARAWAGSLARPTARPSLPRRRSRT